MQSDELKIVFCFDKKYIEYAKIAIKSLLRSKIRNVFIYMITTECEEKDLLDIINLISAFDANYKIFYVNYHELDFCKPMAHLKMPTYLRLFIPSLIKEDKIIYLDCDVYVNQDLGELFDLNLGNATIAVVEDVSQECKEKLKLKNEYYFNAGVLRWDLNKINREKFIEECREIYNKYQNELSYGDQCILNVLFDNKKIIVPADWNELVLIQHIYYPVLEYFIEHKRKIIHFCGAIKPWECEFGTAGWKFWHKYML